METITILLFGFIIGNGFNQEIINHELNINNQSNIENKIIEKTVYKYPKDISYIIDLKKNPVKVIVLKEKDIEKL